jgi:cytosine/uracil/thiamine/allantoin permease
MSAKEPICYFVFFVINLGLIILKLASLSTGHNIGFPLTLNAFLALFFLFSFLKTRKERKKGKR